MPRIQKLILLVVASGTISGLLLYLLQHYTTFPLIKKAEVYESAQEQQSSHVHEHAEWQPSEGTERTVYTVASTVARVSASLSFLGDGRLQFS